MGIISIQILPVPTRQRPGTRLFDLIKAIFFALALIIVVVQPTRQAFADSSLEYRVKAAFLYNFTKFVKWPEKAFPNAKSPIKICILGESPFNGALDTIRNKTAGGRKIEVLEANGVQDIDNCHILFVSAGSEEEFFRSLEHFQKLSILTVGDRKGFAQRGCVMNFLMVEKKVRFEINTKSAEKADLKISSQLLKIARIVGED